MKFSPDGTTLAAVVNDTMVVLWEVRTSRITAVRTTRYKSWVSAVAFSPDGRTAALLYSTLPYASAEDVSLWKLAG